MTEFGILHAGDLEDENSDDVIPVVDCERCVAPCCSGFSLGAYGYKRGGVRPDGSVFSLGVVATPAHAAVFMADEWETLSGGRATVRLGLPNDMHPIAFEARELSTLDPYEFDGFDWPRLRCTAHGTDGRCTIYLDRPKACRIYDCRTDPIRELEGENARCLWPRVA